MPGARGTAVCSCKARRRPREESLSRSAGWQARPWESRLSRALAGVARAGCGPPAADRLSPNFGSATVLSDAACPYPRGPADDIVVVLLRTMAAAAEVHRVHDMVPELSSLWRTDRRR